MAKVEVISFVDDLDGKELDLDDAHTISWSWVGVDYQLDVSSANLEKIENGKVPVSKLLEVSTRIGGRRQSTAPRVRSTTPQDSGDRARRDTAAIRQWATEAGYEISPRGRLPKEIIEAYEAEA
ncbi:MULTISPECIES: Lsr2 family protein [Gordonia]|uniref:histone-like nucleoid-structuring protein Lsr2 n=1 Tax=Gordonia TaxID=2053 RepID=UPI000A79E9B7|nr:MULTISPECIES: Lsr2 family protein [Gordonia]WLP91365.1 Lsr2 family protein [Gordonia sp. NB41Y]